MHTAPPTLKRHKTGQFRARWGGRDYYFGADQAEARRLFLSPQSEHPGSLARWQEWRSRREADRPRAPTSLTVAGLIKLFLASYAEAGRPDTEEYYREKLRRFGAVYKNVFVSEIRPTDVAAFVKTLSGLDLSPKTISHNVGAVRMLFRWGSAAVRGHCQPLNLSGLEVPAVGRGTPEPMDPREIKAAIQKVSAVYPELEAYIRLNYLAALRPSEVCRLASGEGLLKDIPPELAGRRRTRPIKDGQVLLRIHKMERAQQQDRVIPLSSEALEAFRQLKPLPVEYVKRRSRPPRVRDLQKRYALLLRRAGVPAIAHRLRDSAATHLLEAGVDRGSVSQVLGHAERGELANYGRRSARLLRQTVSILTLR